MEAEREQTKSRDIKWFIFFITLLFLLLVWLYIQMMSPSLMINGIYFGSSIDINNNEWSKQTLLSCLGTPFGDIDTYFAFSNNINKNHFMEIWQSTKKYRDQPMHSYAAYGGPWIENYWINTFSPKAFNNTNNFKSIFSVFIPLFIQWTDLIILNNSKVFCEQFVYPLFQSFDTSFVYVTVIQHDEGIMSWIKKCHHNDKFMRLWNDLYSKQILIISAGGVGHVPIPLCKQRQLRCTEQYPLVTHDNKTHMIGLIGARHCGRSEIIESVLKNIKSPRRYLQVYEGIHWVYQECNCCKFILTPRGYGRTAFSFCENIQMGNIPIYVWNDYPWIPYTSMADEFSISFRWSNDSKQFANNIESTLKKIYDNKTRYNLMLEWSTNNVDEYFTFNGIMKQIGLFLKYGPNKHNKLQCQPYHDLIIQC